MTLRTKIAVLYSGILLAALVVRVWNLGVPQLTGDEGFTYLLASLSYPELARTILRIGEPQPVASFFLERAWLLLGGSSEFNLRMLNVWFGVLAVALIWRLTSFIIPRCKTATEVGVWVYVPSVFTSLVIAFNRFGIEHSREYRTYAMVMALTLAAVLSSVTFVKRPTFKSAFSSVALGWSAIQAHYVGAFVIAAINVAFAVFWLVNRKARIATSLSMRPWVTIQLAIVALTAPWLILASGTVNTYAGTGTGQQNLVSMIYEQAKLVSYGSSSGAVASIGAAVVVSLVSLGAGCLLLPNCTVKRAFAFSMLVILWTPVLAVWVITWIKPIYHPRYLIISLPTFAIAAGSALSLSSTSRATRTLVVLLSTTLLVIVGAGTRSYFTEMSFSNSWDPLITAFRELSSNLPQTYTRVTVNMPDPAFLYYYRKDSRPLENQNSSTLPQDATDAVSIDRTFNDFASQEVRRVLVHVANRGWWDTRQLAAVLNPKPYHKVDTRWLVDSHIDVYEQSFGDHATPLNINYANHVELLSAEVLTDTLQTAVAVEIHIRAPSTGMSSGSKIFLHLVNAATGGTVIQQVDLALAIESQFDKSVILGMPVSSVPPGPYELWFGMYDESLPGSPRILTDTGQDHIVIAKISFGSI